MQSCSDVVMRACQYYLCDVKSEGVVLIVKLMSRVMQLYSTNAPALIQPLLPTILRKLLEEEVWSPLTQPHPLLVLCIIGLPSHHHGLPESGGQGAGPPAHLLLHLPGEDVFSGPADSKPSGGGFPQGEGEGLFCMHFILYVPFSPNLPPSPPLVRLLSCLA